SNGDIRQYKPVWTTWQRRFLELLIKEAELATDRFLIWKSDKDQSINELTSESSEVDEEDAFEFTSSDASDEDEGTLENLLMEQPSPLYWKHFASLYRSVLFAQMNYPDVTNDAVEKGISKDK